MLQWHWASAGARICQGGRLLRPLRGNTGQSAVLGPEELRRGLLLLRIQLCVCYRRARCGAVVGHSSHQSYLRTQLAKHTMRRTERDPFQMQGISSFGLSLCVNRVLRGQALRASSWLQVWCSPGFGGYHVAWCTVDFCHLRALCGHQHRRSWQRHLPAHSGKDR